jgi:acyl carrier protein
MIPCSSISKFCHGFARQETGFFTPKQIRKGRSEVQIALKQPIGANCVDKNRNSTTREQFLLGMDEFLGLPAGTLRGDEKLQELKNWDSTALISLIVLAEINNNVQITPDQVVDCTTIADLLRLAQVDGSSA